MSDNEFTPKHLKHIREYGLTGYERALAAFALKLMDRAEKAEQEEETLRRLNHSVPQLIERLTAARKVVEAAQRECDYPCGEDDPEFRCENCKARLAALIEYDRVVKGEE